MLIGALAAMLVAGLLAIGLAAWWAARGRTRARRVEQEYLDAYRALRVQVGVLPEQARFSYRPATRELMLDAVAAHRQGLHDLGGAACASSRFLTLQGWHALPAAAAAAGWIDEALAEGLALRQPVECEFLARTAGQADRYFLLTAVPLHTADVLVGALAQTFPAHAAAAAPRSAAS